MPKTFTSFNDALAWGKTHGRENVHPFQFWRVVKQAANAYRVGIYSRNSGKFAGFAY